METSVITMILRNGMPTGIVQCNLDEWIGVSYKIPRNRLNESKELKNIENTGVYILFGVDEETGENRAYIGEAENIYKRLLQHNKTKDFWNDCLVFVSQNNSLNKAHIKFIENMLYTKAKEVERFIIDNDTEPTKSSLDGADEIRAVKFYEKIVLLTSVYGYRIFDKILTQQEVKEEEKKKASDLFDRKSDICIDTIGSNQTITQCLDYIKETGTIAVYGLKSGENLNVPLPELRNFNIQYVQWPVPEVEAEVHKPVCDAIMDGKIDIDLFVTHRFSIDDYEKGFQAVKDRTALKVVLNF